MPAAVETEVPIRGNPLVLPDGGFVLLGSNHGTALLLSLYNASGEQIGSPTPIRYGNPVQFGGGAFLYRESSTCEPQGQLFGRPLLNFNPRFDPISSSSSSTLFHLDYSEATMAQVLRVGPDCSRTLVLEASNLREPVLTAEGGFAYVAGRSPGRLHGVDDSGLLWTLDLPFSSATPRRLAHNDDLLLETGTELWRVGKDGTLRWKTGLAYQGVFRSPYLVAGDASGSYYIVLDENNRQFVQGIDTDGNPSWSARLEDERLSHAVGALNGDTLWLASSLRGDRVVKFGDDGALIEVLPPLSRDQRVAAQLAGGELLVLSGVRFPPGPPLSVELERLELSSGERHPVPEPRAALGRELRGAAKIATGVVTAHTHRGGDASLLVKLSDNGEVQWTTEVSRTQVGAPSLAGVGPLMLAGDEQQVCGLDEAIYGVSIQCFGTETGEPLGPVFSIPGETMDRASQLRVLEDGSIEVLGSPFVSLQPNEQGLVRVRVDKSGELLAYTRLDPGGEGGLDSLQHSNGVTAIWRHGSSSTRVDVVAEDGSTLANFDFPGLIVIKAHDGSGTVLALDDDLNLLQIGPQGRVHWMRSGLGEALIRANDLPGGDWLLSLASNGEDVALARVAAEDGPPVPM
ncbi:hypothetical protein [Pseudomarimonas arenosa]|uniref:Pyrroloquinoline-quinone binding quinoprotein n=1 Tax=Pseudomarimonas arenosa TaxID=2774145 RepID=A0AAW3ZPT3_9GAMM|nr:hypothetical protein [Pseudomarimonas arenosa]MBD8526945.1 hypothetical protein [Pseudomarimonas arenosa]